MRLLNVRGPICFYIIYINAFPSPLDCKLYEGRNLSIFLSLICLAESSTNLFCCRKKISSSQYKLHFHFCCFASLLLQLLHKIKSSSLKLTSSFLPSDETILLTSPESFFPTSSGLKLTLQLYRLHAHCPHPEAVFTDYSVYGAPWSCAVL